MFSGPQTGNDNTNYRPGTIGKDLAGFHTKLDRYKLTETGTFTLALRLVTWSLTQLNIHRVYTIQTKFLTFNLTSSEENYFKL